MTIEAFPLCWPEGWSRTEACLIDRSRFQQTPDAARRFLLDQIRMLIGNYNYKRDEVIISTNIPLRRDGEPYASHRNISDHGAAVYFKYNDKPMVFACDKWDSIRDNIYAIGKTVEALRGIERWGASDMMERAFTGFTALEYQPDETWQNILQVGNRYTLEECERNYRVLARETHPDKGGSEEAMQKLNWAREQARKELRQ